MIIRFRVIGSNDLALFKAFKFLILTFQKFEFNFLSAFQSYLS